MIHNVIIKLLLKFREIQLKDAKKTIMIFNEKLILFDSKLCKKILILKFVEIWLKDAKKAFKNFY